MKEHLIKLYFYVTSGQAFVDRFRYLIMGVFALYVMLKLTNPVYLVVMLLAAVPVLFVLGWYEIHKISKVRERLSVKYGTHYTLKSFELQEESVKLLQEIKDTLTQKYGTKS